MKIWNCLIGMLIAGLAHNPAASEPAPDEIQFRMNPALTDIGVIKVDGERDGTYGKIATKTLEYGVYVRGDHPRVNDVVGQVLSLWLDGGEVVRSTMTSDWKKYTLTMPYRALPSSTPIRLCNDRLQATSGARRQEFLKQGEMFTHGEAYSIHALSIWFHDHPSSPPGSLDFEESIQVPVKIKCLALNRDRSQDAEPYRTSEPLPPLFWATALKIEPAKMVRDGTYMCPSELKLYGFVETGRKFQGKAIFMGPHYLSAITPLNFSYAGTRNVVATYPVKWKEIGGLTTTSDPKPKKQKLTFHFNISNNDGKLIKSVKKTMDVSCTKIEAEAPVGMTGSPPTDPLEP
ncbi:MAG: hypothetical protein HC861_00225 [Rhodospirillaceae bacterium]|nr:hypothetical protein [Rhodospirillaceae bacterium]